MAFKDDFVIMQSASDEEYIDDPILIIDEGDKLSPSEILEYMTSKTNSEATDNISNVSLTNKALGTTNNKQLLTKCKSFDIKIVDYVKYPHYYKNVKTIQEKNITKEETNTVKVVSCFFLSPKSPKKTETKNNKCRNTQKPNTNIKVSETSDKEIEYVQTFTTSDGLKNKATVNFKRNVGLVGIKISNVELLSGNPLKRTETNQPEDRSKKPKNQRTIKGKRIKLTKYDASLCNESTKVTTVNKQENKDIQKGKIFRSKISKNEMKLRVHNMTKTNSDDNMKLVEQNKLDNNLRTETGKDILDNKLRKKFMKDIKLITSDSFPRAIEQPEIGIVRPMTNTITPTLLTNPAITKCPDIHNNLSKPVNAINDSPQANSIHNNCVQKLPRGDPPPYSTHNINCNTSINHLNNPQQEPKKYEEQNRNYINYQDCTYTYSTQTNQNSIRSVSYQASYSALPALPSLDDKICRTPLTKQFVNTNETLSQIPPTQTSEKQDQESNGSGQTTKIQPNGQLRHYTSENQHGQLNGHEYSAPELKRYLLEQPSSNAVNDHKKMNPYQHCLASLKQLTYSYPAMRPKLHYGQSQPHQTNFRQPLHNQHLQGQTSPNLRINGHSEPNQLLERGSTVTFKSNGQPAFNQHFANQASTNTSYTGQPVPNQHFANQSSANTSYAGQPVPNQHFANQSSTNTSYNGQPVPNQHFANQSSTNTSYNGQPVPNQHFANQASTNTSYTGQPVPNQHFANQSSADLSYNRQTTPNQHFSNQSSTNTSYNGQPMPNKQGGNKLLKNLLDNGLPAPNQHFANQTPTNILCNGQQASNISVQQNDQPTPNQPIYNNAPYLRQKTPTFSQDSNQTQSNRHIPIQPLPMQCVTGQPRKRQYDQHKPPQAKNHSIIGCNAEGWVKRINIQKKTSENLPEVNKTGSKNSGGQPSYNLFIDKKNLKIDIRLRP